MKRTTTSLPVMNTSRSALGIALVGVAMAGCNAPEPPPGTGGTDVEPGVCGRGLVVVESDYQSTNVSLLGVDGSVLSSSFLSSASTGTGLSAPLSGDVAVPTSLADGPELVLVDRYPAAVLTFVRVESATVRAQLPVGTGFAANPQDYLAWSANEAYVSRLDPNAAPGAEPFDQGSDLLVVDPSVPAIVGRIDLDGALAGLGPELFARPSRMLRVGDRLVVLSSPSDSAFMASAEARLVVIDPASGAIDDTALLPGLHGCSALALSDEGTRLAVGCSGRFEGGSTPTLTESGLVVLAVTELPTDGGAGGIALAVEASFPAADLVGQPIGFAVDFAAEATLVATAFGRFEDGSLAAEPDYLFELDSGTGALRRLLQTAEVPFSLGEVRCTGRCGRCYAADAERGVVHELRLGEAGLTIERAIVVDTAVGLPPRLVGRF